MALRTLNLTYSHSSEKDNPRRPLHTAPSTNVTRAFIVYSETKTAARSAAGPLGPLAAGHTASNPQPSKAARDAQHAKAQGTRAQHTPHTPHAAHRAPSCCCCLSALCRTEHRAASAPPPIRHLLHPPSTIPSVSVITSSYRQRQRTAQAGERRQRCTATHARTPSRCPPPKY